MKSIITWTSTGTVINNYRYYEYFQLWTHANNRLQVRYMKRNLKTGKEDCCNVTAYNTRYSLMVAEDFGVKL